MVDVFEDGVQEFEICVLHRCTSIRENNLMGFGG